MEFLDFCPLPWGPWGEGGERPAPQSPHCAAELRVTNGFGRRGVASRVKGADRSIWLDKPERVSYNVRLERWEVKDGSRGRACPTLRFRGGHKGTASRTPTLRIPDGHLPDMRPHVTQKKKEARTTKPTGRQERDGATLAATWPPDEGPRPLFFPKTKPPSY